MSDTENISLSAATELIVRALLRSGAAENCARSVAGALVAAEAEGQVGHGFSRLSDYVAQMRSGKVDPAARPVCQVHGSTFLIVDAGNGFAFPALDLAIERLVETAHAHGTASVGLMNSHHCGALSVQVDKIAQAGLVGIMVANSPPAIAPWGARTPVFGTNPIAFSAPRRDGPPLVIDLSLSRVARGKVMHAKKSGMPIPEGWALDSEGNPTTDPERGLAGSMVPIGEAKGTALALMVEVLAAMLPGANPSVQVSSFFAADGPPCGAGQFLMAFRPGNLDSFIERIEPILTLVSEMEGARLPGVRRAAALADARQNGLQIPRHYLDQARALGALND